MNAGIVPRIAIASILLALVVGAGFVVLLRELDVLRASGRAVTHTRTENAVVDAIERRVIDLETGVRGFAITGQPRYLAPWAAARSALPQEVRQLAALADTPDQARRTRKLAADIDSYVEDYTVPLVAAVRRDRRAGLGAAVTAEGKRRTDALRGQFDGFRAAERARVIARQERDDRNAVQVASMAAAALGVSVVLILLCGLYLMRAIAVPLRGASAMADRVAGGDLAVRLGETGVGEVAGLQRAFNRMASSLETNRDELRRLAEEQAALRRVATLVARGVPAGEIFEAVANETRRVLDLDASGLMRFESDGGVTLVAADSARPLAIEVGARLSPDPGTTAARVRRTGRPAWVDAHAAADPLSRRAGDSAGGGAMGAPIVVDGQVWGVMVATWAEARAIPPGGEQRLVQFTELAATAIANTQARGELTASRARIVATADETRRRIERDLHDGAQQRLVSLMMQLRAAQAAVPPEGGQLAGELDAIALGLDGALDDLRELARGIHPAILAEGGLGPALRVLARRSAVPVELDVRTADRLPEPVESGAYFIVAEALTNAAKHAGATVVRIDVEASDGALRVRVRDDGVGGADFAAGSGLVGLRDRVEALGGRIELRSESGSGTSLSFELPLPGD